jgi:hypothetical protein
MARKLVWLENRSFAAWGCEACNWLFQNIRAAVPRKPSTFALEAFNKHDCAEFLRQQQKNARLAVADSDSL